MTAINIADNTVFVQLHSIDAEVILSQTDKHASVKCYRQSSKKIEFDYQFQSLNKAIEYIDKWVSFCERNIKKSKENIQLKSHYSIGDIFYTSWGYDHTHVDFFQIILAPSNCTILLSKINQEYGYSDNLRTTKPLKNNLIGDSFLKRIRPDGYLIIDTHLATKWEGKPELVSNSYY